MHISSIEGVDDMILLGDLKESAILHNLHMRYKKDNIYVNLSIFKKENSTKSTSFFFRHIPDPF